MKIRIAEGQAPSEEEKEKTVLDMNALLKGVEKN